MRISWKLAACFAATMALHGQPPPLKQSATIRGQRQDLYCFPAPAQPKGRVLFLPGDRGWAGFAIDIGRAVSSWGYAVCGMDTKRYLESFTSGSSTLKETDIGPDMRAAATAVPGPARDRVIYLGWSEGANMGAVATASPGGGQIFKGAVALGLSQNGVLGWRWQDNVTYVTRKDPDEPRYATGPYLPKIAPLPFLMIHATKDEYTPLDSARKLFDLAAEPKRFRVVEADNHRFDGNHDDFFRALKEGLEWVNQTAR